MTRRQNTFENDTIQSKNLEVKQNCLSLVMGLIYLLVFLDNFGGREYYLGSPSD